MTLATILASVPADLSPQEFRDALKHLGFSQVGFAKFIEYDDRQVRHWIAGNWPVPRVVVELLAALEKLADLQDRILKD
jgi:DNA-binding transcriptional regulator YiaG